MKWQELNLKQLLPLAILAVSIFASGLLFVTKPAPKIEETITSIPEVKVLKLQSSPVQIRIKSQGVVSPREEIDLLNEVAGKVTHLHPALVAGGYFKTGDVLLTIDARDYDYAIVTAQARIAEAKRILVSEQAQVEQAKNEWQALGQGKPSALALHQPQLAEAEAKLMAAEADLALAKLNRSRCELKAPFNGRVLHKQAGLGQFLPAGSPVARIFDSSLAEIRLPITEKQMSLLNLGQLWSDSSNEKRPLVKLSAQLAGESQQWQGTLVRTEAAMSDDSSQIHLIAQVIDPFNSVKGQWPMFKGLFVQAEIDGKQIDAIQIPKSTVSPMQTVNLLDAEQHLHIQPIEFIEGEGDQLIVFKGLANGDSLIQTELPMAVSGTELRAINE